MKHILYMHPNGSMACCTLNEGERRKIELAPEQVVLDDNKRTMEFHPAQYRMETDGEFLARIRATDVPEGATHVIVMDHASLPTDMRFWECHHTREGTIVLDMAKARDRWRDILRQKREAPLARLDVAFQRALEEDQPKAARDTIIAKKQALRDITKDPRIDSATNLAELTAVELPE